MRREATHECHGPGGMRVAVIFHRVSRTTRQKSVIYEKGKRLKGQASEMQRILTGRNTRRRLVSKKARQARASVQRGAEVGAGGKADRPRKEHFLPRKANRLVQEGTSGRSARWLSLAPSLLSSFTSPHSLCLCLSLSFSLSTSEILVVLRSTPYLYLLRTRCRGVDTTLAAYVLVHASSDLYLSDYSAWLALFCSQRRLCPPQTFVSLVCMPPSFSLLERCSFVSTPCSRPSHHSSQARAHFTSTTLPALWLCPVLPISALPRKKTNDASSLTPCASWLLHAGRSQWALQCGHWLAS